MRSWHTHVRTILCCLIANLSAVSVGYSAPVTFDNDTTISASNLDYDGKDIIVDNTTLVIDGSHQFNSVFLINGATLTHSKSPTNPLVISSKLFLIDATSSINLEGKGNLPTPDVTGSSAGSYGGLGGEYLGTTNPVFGDNKFPTDFGIGGIGDVGTTLGGGAIKIISSELILDGSINANGEGFNTFWNSQGGGSGGSVFIDAGSFTGTGTISTNGGSGYTFLGGGGGGGGRIAVYYDSTDFDLQNNIINIGGVCKPLFGEQGQPGSIHFESKTTNLPPVAVIAPLEPVAENTIATLDGSSSSDNDGSIVSYNWTQTDGPTVTINNATDAVAHFTAPQVYQDTTLSFHLEVFDNNGNTATATTSTTVYNTNSDDDADGMPDIWEIQFFNTLDHDGTLDSDNDGATDIQEYQLNTNPTVEQHPVQPEIISPDDTEVSSLQPLMTLTNPGQATEFSVSYQYEVYSDATMLDLVAETTNAGLSWTVNIDLSDNTQYYWRARAAGTTLYSEWVSSKFFVNTVNDAPGTFNISYPLEGVWVSSLLPELSVTNSVDIDGDSLSYSFEVFLDSDLTQTPVASTSGVLPDASGTTSWTVNKPLLENNWYSWRVIVTDEHGLSTVSNSTPMIFINTVNDAPTVPVLNAPANNSEITTLSSDLSVNNSSDPENEPLHYLFELDTVETFDSTNKQSSYPVPESQNITSWTTTGLLDNTWYYWRSKASDGLSESAWVEGRFFVNQFNDAPGIPKAFNPGNNAWVGNLQPSLEVTPVIDIDGDSVSYEFNVYSTDKHGDQLNLIMSGSSDSTSWQLATSLNETGYYYWHARAVDEHGLAGEWGEPTMFFADSDGINDAPTIKLKKLKYEQGDVLAIHKYESKRRKNKNESSFVEVRWKDNDSDTNASIQLYYDTDKFGEDGVLITQDLLEDPDGQSDRFLWDVSQIQPGTYYVYATINDGHSSSTSYSKNAVVIGNGDGLPFLLFTSQDTDNNGSRNQQANISWRDLDHNSNASISLYYDTDATGFDGTLIVSGIEEDQDGNNDMYLWNVSDLPSGEYFVYAVISDETNSYRVYANKSFPINHHGNKGR